MILVDTSVWYAAFVPNSSGHEASADLIHNHLASLITTDYVIDELATLLSRRGVRHTAITRMPALLDGTLCHLETLTKDDFLTAWNIFSKFTDKEWSFTDCTSYAVMQRLGINQAFALDGHFKQFGFAEIQP